MSLKSQVFLRPSTTREVEVLTGQKLSIFSEGVCRVFQLVGGVNIPPAWRFLREVVGEEWTSDTLVADITRFRLDVGPHGATYDIAVVPDIVITKPPSTVLQQSFQNLIVKSDPDTAFTASDLLQDVIYLDFTDARDLAVPTGADLEATVYPSGAGNVTSASAPVLNLSQAFSHYLVSNTGCEIARNRRQIRLVASTSDCFLTLAVRRVSESVWEAFVF